MESKSKLWRSCRIPRHPKAPPIFCVSSFFRGIVWCGRVLYSYYEIVLHITWVPKAEQERKIRSKEGELSKSRPVDDLLSMNDSVSLESAPCAILLLWWKFPGPWSVILSCFSQVYHWKSLKCEMTSFFYWGSRKDKNFNKTSNSRQKRSTSGILSAALFETLCPSCTVSLVIRWRRPEGIYRGLRNGRIFY